VKNGKKVYVIACKVLRPDIQDAAKKAGLDVDFEFLPFGLHNTPAELTREVQKQIDAASASGKYEKIILGYGICGKGTVNIQSRQIPLVIPQAHDCITLFLGSAAEYKEQFGKCPGTYYFTKGWFDENPNYEVSLRIGLNIETPGKTYTPDELQIMEEFLAGWQKNYSRAVFVRSSENDEDECYRKITKDIAQGYGWKYEEFIGSTELMEKVLTAEKSSDEVLMVPSGHKLTFNEVASKLETIKE